MRQTQENKIRMFRAVWVVLQKYLSVWKDNVAFKKFVDKLDNLLKAIEAITGPAEAETSGVTDDKQQMKEDLIHTIMEISGPFSAIADDNGDKELVAKVTYTDSQLEDMTDLELANAGKSLASLATIHATELATAGIIATDIEALETLSKKYSDITTGSRTAVTGRSTSKGELENLVRTTSRLLKRNLNRMVIAYRRKNTLFHEEYFAARKVIPYGVRHEKKDEGTTK
jgi:hypothetical protein